jgi:hypothetical protein
MADKRAEREIFFKSELEGFFNSDYNDRIDLIKQECKIHGLTFEAPDGIESEINNRFWNLVDNHTRPVLVGSKTEPDDRIDLYKILSCIEYTICGLRPFIIKIDGKSIDYSSEINYNLVHSERKLNGLFAFSTAFNFLRSWGSDPHDDLVHTKYSDIFKTFNFLEILDKTEDIRNRENSMTRLDEHILILTYSVISPVWPIFMNSTWWRLLCAFAIEQNKNNN